MEKDQTRNSEPWYFGREKGSISTVSAIMWRFIISFESLKSNKGEVEREEGGGRGGGTDVRK